MMSMSRTLRDTAQTKHPAPIWCMSDTYRDRYQDPVLSPNLYAMSPMASRMSEMDVHRKTRRAKNLWRVDEEYSAERDTTYDWHNKTVRPLGHE